MKKTLYLHIGGPKTGTTTIQSFLTNNRDILKSKGYLYPKIDYLYPEISFLKDYDQNGIFLRGDYIPHSDTNFTAEQIQDICKHNLSLILNSKYNKIIISEESLSSIARAEYACKSLKLSENFDVYIIAYFRKTIETTCSMYQTRAAHGASISLSSLTSTMINNGLLNSIYRYESTLGKDKIITRIYDRELLKNRCSIDDFCDTIGLSDISDFKPATNFNLSVGRNCAEIYKIIGNVLKNKEDYHKMCNNMKIKLDNDPKVIETISDKEIEEFTNIIYPLECAVAKDFFGREELFNSKYPEIYGKPREPYTGISNEIMLEFLMKYINYKFDNKFNSNNHTVGIFKQTRRWLFQLRWNKNEKSICIFGKYFRW